MVFYYISLFHVAFTVLIVNYPFLVDKNYYYDFIYILLMFGLLYSYIYLNGECFVSYFVKKYKNPNYLAGTNVSVMDEYKTVLFNSEFIAKYCIYYILIAMIVAGFIVLRRHRFLKPIFVYLFSGSLFVYFLLLRINTNKNFIKCYNATFFFYITFLLYKLLSYHKMV
jgi:hypothetical protein